jgi:hypothetical protein
MVRLSGSSDGLAAIFRMIFWFSRSNSGVKME